jgi:hypothetical protein
MTTSLPGHLAGLPHTSEEEAVEVIARALAIVDGRNPDEETVPAWHSLDDTACHMWQRYESEARQQMALINAKRGQAILSALGYAKRSDVIEECAKPVADAIERAKLRYRNCDPDDTDTLWAVSQTHNELQIVAKDIRSLPSQKDKI